MKPDDILTPEERARLLREFERAIRRYAEPAPGGTMMGQNLTTIAQALNHGEEAAQILSQLTEGMELHQPPRDQDLDYISVGVTGSAARELFERIIRWRGLCYHQPGTGL